MLPTRFFSSGLNLFLLLALFYGSFDPAVGIPADRCASAAASSGAAFDPSGGKMPRLLEEITPPGWTLAETVQRYTPENLYRQIDGRAEFFLSYDLVQMIFAAYADPSHPETFIDVSIYDMGNPANAFGVFSAERQKPSASLDLGRGGYRAGSSLFIWKGSYYIRMISSGDNALLQKINLDMAAELTESLDDSGEPVWGLDALPKTDRIVGSEQYFRKDAMGLDFMEGTYMARYRKRGLLITAFLARAKHPADPGDIMRRYTAYATQFGEGSSRITRNGVVIILCDMGGSYDALFQKNGMVAGVSAVEDRGLALDSAYEIWRDLPGR